MARHLCRAVKERKKERKKKKVIYSVSKLFQVLKPRPTFALDFGWVNPEQWGKVMSFMTIDFCLQTEADKPKSSVWPHRNKRILPGMRHIPSKHSQHGIETPLELVLGLARAAGGHSPQLGW